MGVKKIRFPATSGIGIKPISREGTERLVRAAIEYALAQKRKSVTLVHKGNIMKFTEGAFRDWGYALATREFRDAVRHRARELDPRQQGGQARPLRRGQREADRARLRHDDARPAGEACARRSRPRSRSGRRTATASGREAAADQGLDRRHHAPAGADAPEGLRRHRDAEPERRLPLRRARGAGRRHRHRARRQHQLRHRPRDLRGHARHRAEVREPRPGEPRLGHPLRRDDVPLPRLGRGRGPDHQGHGRRDRRQDRHLRLPPPDGRREAAQVLGVRGRDHQHM